MPKFQGNQVPNPQIPKARTTLKAQRVAPSLVQRQHSAPLNAFSPALYPVWPMERDGHAVYLEMPKGGKMENLDPLW